MAAPHQKSLFRAVRPVASANTSVLGVVERLVKQAQETEDEITKQKLLDAAKELISASDTITEALEEVARS
jgi:AmiR/NasT family two-component response regulator